MSDLWIVLAVCVFFVIGGAVPLLRKRGPGNEPPIPRKETLRDWRNDK